MGRCGFERIASQYDYDELAGRYLGVVSQLAQQGVS
jgi:hypothetical protein